MKIKNLLLIAILLFLLLFTYNTNNREGFYISGGGSGDDTMKNMITHRYNELLKKEKDLKQCHEELQTYKNAEEDGDL